MSLAPFSLIVFPELAWSSQQLEKLWLQYYDNWFCFSVYVWRGGGGGERGERVRGQQGGNCPQSPSFRVTRLKYSSVPFTGATNLLFFSFFLVTIVMFITEQPNLPSTRRTRVPARRSGRIRWRALRQRLSRRHLLLLPASSRCYHRR